MDEDERQIRALIEIWFEASRTGDIARILDLVAEDAVFTVTGRPPFGKKAFAEALEFMRGVAIEGSYEIAEVETLGDWAFLRNRIDIVMTPNGGAATIRRSYTLTIFRKEADGRWRLARDANVMGDAPR